MDVQCPNPDCGQTLLLTVLVEKRKWFRTKTCRETLDLELTAVAGDPDRAYAAVVGQMLAFRDNPSVLPRCPGCDRVIKPGTTRCAYCGAKWD